MLSDDDMVWLTRELGATYALLGKQIAAAPLAILVQDLQHYGRDQLAMAMGRVRMEHTGQLTPATFMHYLEQAYGRLPPAEAYALAMTSQDERATVVWTDEIAQAWGAACRCWRRATSSARARPSQRLTHKSHRKPAMRGACQWCR